MTTSKDAVISDTEGQEKPVRKQLQKASISRASGEIMESSTQPGKDTEERAEREESADQPEGGEKPEAAQGLRKKRSFEEIDDPETDERPAAHTRSQHTRKRSRDSTAEENELNNGRKISGERKRDVAEAEDAFQSNGDPSAPTIERPGTPEPKGGKRGEEKVEAMTSPKTKRSRLHSATADEKPSAATALDEEAETKEAAAPTAFVGDVTNTASDKAASETAAKPPSETKSPTIPPGSGFANTSATSPFGAMAPPKSPQPDQPQTSSSAFAASGFGSLAGTATSGFGALGKTSGGPAGGWSSKASKPAVSTETNGTDKPVSTFGGALGQQSGFGTGAGGSAFGSSGGSAFGGKLGGGGAFGGSGFGSLGGGAGLSSFASGKPSPFATGSAKPARPFGAPADEDEVEEGGGDEDDGGESGLKSPLSQESDKQDERFYAQDHETGEEGEATEYSCRAKLYNFAVVDEEKGKKEWKERGLGTLRLNTARPASDDESDRAVAKRKARLVMRADGSHRLILNTPVQKDIKFGAANGGPPVGGLVLFMGAVDGKKSLEMLQLKIRQQFALELYEKIKELQEAM